MKNLIKSISRFTLIRYARKSKLGSFLESNVRDRIAEHKARKNYLNRVIPVSINNVHLSQIKNQFEKNGFIKLTRDELSTKDLNISLDSISYNNVFSSSFDYSTNEEVIVTGRGGGFAFQETYILPDSIIDNLYNIFMNAEALLANIKKMSFDLRYVTTYRLIPFEGADFQSSMWHIDFVRQTSHEYKLMLFLDNVMENSGPMKISDIRINRSYRFSGEYRISENYVNKHAGKITECLGLKNEGYLFETQMIHKGGRVKDKLRDVCVLSFVPGVGNISNFKQIAGSPGRYKLSNKVSKGWD
jgi:hypothetical protein